MISRLTKRSQKFVIQLHQSLLGLDQFLQSEACKLCSFEKKNTWPVESAVFEDWTGRKWDISEAWWSTDFFSCGLTTQVL